MKITKLLSCITLAFVAGSLAAPVAWGAKLDLSIKPAKDEVTLVNMAIESTGQLSMNPNNKKVVQAPMKVKGSLYYEERVLDTNVARPRSIRYYRRAEADIRVGEADVKSSLAPERRLIVAACEKDATSIFSPTTPLFREEMDLVDVPANTLALPGLTPTEKQDKSQTWTVNNTTLCRLLRLDGVSKSTVKGKVTETAGASATVEIAGELSGAVEGVATEITLKIKLKLNTASHSPDWVILSIDEKRSIGHAQPGFDAKTTIRMGIATAKGKHHVAEDQITGMQLEPAPGTELVAFRSRTEGFSMVHDRRWRVMSDSKKVTIMRMVDKGNLVAQLNISRLEPLETGKKLSVDEFKADIRGALKSTLTAFNESDVQENEGVRTIRVNATGEAGQLAVQWTCFHLSKEDGARYSLVFTYEAKYADRFAGQDDMIRQAFEILK